MGRSWDGNTNSWLEIHVPPKIEMTARVTHEELEWQLLNLQIPRVGLICKAWDPVLSSRYLVLECFVWEVGLVCVGEGVKGFKQSLYMASSRDKLKGVQLQFNSAVSSLCGTRSQSFPIGKDWCMHWEQKWNLLQQVIHCIWVIWLDRKKTVSLSHLLRDRNSFEAVSLQNGVYHKRIFSLIGQRSGDLPGFLLNLGSLLSLNHFFSRYWNIELCLLHSTFLANWKKLLILGK